MREQIVPCTRKRGEKVASVATCRRASLRSRDGVTQREEEATRYGLSIACRASTPFGPASGSSRRVSNDHVTNVQSGM